MSDFSMRWLPVTVAADPRGVVAPGADQGGMVYAVDYSRLLRSQFLAVMSQEISAKDLDVVVIGGGDTGTDCVATAVRRGAKSVHQLEYNAAPPEKRLPPISGLSGSFIKKPIMVCGGY